MNTSKLKQVYLDTVFQLIEKTTNSQTIHEKATRRAALAVWKDDQCCDFDDLLIEAFSITGLVAESIGL